MTSPKLSAVMLCLMSSTALADAPRVVTDIAPVHSLVSLVMAGVGEPDLILPPGASPHGFALRPSDAAAIEAADLIFHVGGDLSPSFETSVEKLAKSANVIALLDAPEATRLPFREDARFASHDHEDHDDHEKHEDHDDHRHEGDHDDHAKHEEHDHDDHKGHDDHEGHTDHDDHEGHDDHEDHAKTDDHDHDGDKDRDGHDDHDHAHGDVDPHAWLDPENARAWLDVIARDLSTRDPENAALYAANADQARADIATLITSLDAELAPVRDKGFVVFHDAYQYFETRFDLASAGAISIGDATKPSPARLAEIRDVVASANVTCVFAEPQYNAGLVSAVQDGTGLNTGILDPLGASLTPGGAFYGDLLRGMSATMVECLK